MPRTMNGRTAVITGASGGIGAAVAVALAEAGAKVALAGRDRAALERTAARCRAADVPVLTVPFDVTVAAECAEAVAAVTDRLAAPTVLVNAAGIGESRRFADVTVDVLREVMKVNVEGPLLLMQAVLPRMVELGRGAIVNIGSTASSVGLPRAAPYTAAKHALLGVTRSAAAEYADKGVTINCVCPYYVDTPMTRRVIEARMRGKGCDYDEAVRPLLTPQGRLTTPEEVAALCLLLASDAGAAITGQALNIDGGRVQG
ncbi:SDR family NAD(P)-dependent oxidoreductase [Nocardia arizonensis]|uniref:SDR family NAD(P)-dependent oxidoreductase n=1 Tax=Nocardia arizonensis TaxID=1141647 RepID=UPI000B2E14FA|nr:SDR family oxidoreductase [Nocardia arizonensis]